MEVREGSAHASINALEMVFLEAFRAKWAEARIGDSVVLFKAPNGAPVMHVEKRGSE